MAEDTTKAVKFDSATAAVANQTTILPDGTAILSGPVPGGQVAAGATQVAARRNDPEVLNFSGVPGGPFTIYGANFGPVGMVHVGGVQVTVTSWQDYRIKGLLPPGLEPPREVVITDGAQRVIKTPWTLKRLEAVAAK